MAPKSKKAAPKAAEKKPVEEPAAKKAKTDEEAKADEEKADAKEEAKELETDAAADSRPKFTDKVEFTASNTTLNVLPMGDGRMLSTLCDGGMQYLIAGARANVGVKSGRYFFELRILEQMNPSEGNLAKSGGKGAQVPRHLIRVGFSTAGSSLVLGDGDLGGVCFDSEGFFIVGNENGRSERTRWTEKGGKGKFGKESVVGILLNLDAKSANANTISLFKNGARVSDAKPLPEAMKGKTLFPHIAYRNTTLQVHWGPTPLKALPFTCTMLKAAAKADVEVTKSTVPKDGKYEVVFPVGFPDEGTFMWCDQFIKENPGYVELSDRKVIEWAKKSGCRRQGKGGFGNMDKPRPDFNVPHLDDFSARRVVNSIASVVPRNYVVMEVKQNLVSVDRKTNLRRFPGHSFKRVAKVVMGEPTATFKGLVKDKLLKDKQGKSDREFRKKIADEKRAKAAEKKKAEIEKKKAEAAEKKKAAEDAKKPAGEKKEEEKKEEEKKEDPPAEEKKEEEKPEAEEKKEEEKEEEVAEEQMAEAPKVTLTEEEEKLWFAKGGTPDLQPNVMDNAYVHFSLPEKDEGFDDVTFEWAKKDGAADYLKKSVLERKKTTRIENLVPGAAFRTAATEWQTKLKEWQAKHKEAKGKKLATEDGATPADAMECENVMDANGKGVPLFVDFQDEDWLLASLRFELFSMAKFYKEELNDEDRVEIPEQHVTFYYQKYHKKTLLLKTFGKETLAEVCTIIKDTAAIEDGHLKIKPAADTAIDHFIKATEEDRRGRQRRIDAGDETARLKITINAAPAPPPPAKGGKGKGK